MFAMQYDIRFPADYDMAVIRRRVAERGHALDDRRGLGLKAYLSRDRARGEPVSSYSPFYLWTDEASAGRFLWGGEGFAGIVHDFHRPSVRTWIGGGFRPGPNVATEPRYAGVDTVDLAPAEDPATAAEAASDWMSAADRPGVHSVAWLVDPSRWVVTRLLLAHDPDVVTGLPVPGARHERFEVLHLSAPDLAGLTGTAPPLEMPA